MFRDDCHFDMSAAGLARLAAVILRTSSIIGFCSSADTSGMGRFFQSFGLDWQSYSLKAGIQARGVVLLVGEQEDCPMFVRTPA